ncbi:OsmC family protein [Burkholderia gladioli]|uniref:OsmC family protein n=1 Tax=Burkholderia gladioli TaxID=28095 RepID=UPI000F540B6E|nr:OsmC family protein [Burkholderia gladioli]
MNTVEKVLTTGKTHTTFSGGPGVPRGHNSRLDIALSSQGQPKPAHTFAAIPPHPTAEQLFAGAWSACYSIALTVAAQALQVTIPAETSVDIEVDLCVCGASYFIQARLFVCLPGLPESVATEIVHKADEICVYSKATRGNIDVEFKVSV